MKNENLRKKFNPMQYVSKKRNKFLIIAISVLTVTALLYLFASPKVYERALPKLSKAYIVLKEENEETAFNKPRTALIGENIIMYAVIEGKELLSKETTFFSQVKDIVIDNKKLPEDRVEKWDRFWKELKIGWIKIEPLFPRYEGKGKTDLSFIKYKYRWRFDGLYYWALPADAKPTSLIEYEIEQVRTKHRKAFSDPKKYPGTMYFRVYAYIHSDDDTINPLREARTPGVETAGPMGLSPEVMRVTFVEDKSFRGFCTGYFNVPYVEGNEELILKTNATERFIAVSKRSYIFESAVQAGYDLKEKSASGLRSACELVYKDLFLASSNYIYPFGKTGVMLPFGKNGVQPGDIIVWGAEQNMAVLNSDGGLEAKADGHFDGTDVVIVADKDGVCKDYLANVVDDKFEVWRLIKKKVND
jgi:hypothetical protein